MDSTKYRPRTRSATVRKCEGHALRRGQSYVFGEKSSNMDRQGRDGRDSHCDVPVFLGINNIVDLPWKDEERIVKFLRNRYMNKLCYCWAGRTLLAVHPYKETTFYNETPSISSVVYRAWFRLVRDLGKLDQAIVITGESGAGKTYSACRAMKYVASRGQDEYGEVLWQVWSSVPLLTAFGNAPTTHNHNSSRFGKLLQLQYNNGNIRGAYIKTYMLEKSRVVAPNPGEGNFHIFRQVLESLDESNLSFLFLSKDVDYRIAPKRILRSTYTETVKALEILNITDLDNILVVLSIILNLGNVCFQLDGEVYTASSDSLEFVENVSALLQTSPASLTDVLCNVQFCAKNIARRSMVYKSACMNREECEERRNCLMKFLYDRLFSWLVDSVNSRICDDRSCKHLGLLDVYGFEVFEHNTFEQLCINYANERLQRHFMESYLVERRNDLLEEGLQVEDIDISDYSARIAIIDGPVSIFGILNEECAVKRFNSDLFVNTRLSETLRGRDHFIGPLNDLNTTFSIIHYAGVVKYDTRSMLLKNRDKIPDDIINFLKECQFEFLSFLVADGREINEKTLLSKFKKSLDELMQTLRASDVHYVKCLKPNPYKISGFFDEDFFGQQLAINGVYELLKLDFEKYSIRLGFEEFIGTFTTAVFNNLLQVLRDEMHVGRKYVYLSEHAYYAFERIRHIRTNIMARKVQVKWFSYYEKRKRAAIVLQRFFRHTWARRGLTGYDKFIDLSKKSGELCLSDDGPEPTGYVSSSTKIQQYLMRHRFDVNFEGDRLSLMLEKVYDNVRTEPFKRVLFCGDRIVSYNRLAEIPVRFHTSRTCMRYSYLLPKSELPKGLIDIF